MCLLGFKRETDIVQGHMANIWVGTETETDKSLESKGSIVQYNFGLFPREGKNTQCMWGCCFRVANTAWNSSEAQSNPGKF